MDMGEKHGRGRGVMNWVLVWRTGPFKTSFFLSGGNDSQPRRFETALPEHLASRSRILSYAAARKASSRASASCSAFFAASIACERARVCVCACVSIHQFVVTDHGTTSHDTCGDASPHEFTHANCSSHVPASSLLPPAPPFAA